MIKVAMISHTNGTEFANNINRFIEDKKVVDIKYNVFPLIIDYKGGVPSKAQIIDRALIIYEED